MMEGGPGDLLSPTSEQGSVAGLTQGEHQHLCRGSSGEENVTKKQQNRS